MRLDGLINFVLIKKKECTLKLPPISSVVNRPNVQLSDLLAPVHSSLSSELVHGGVNVSGGGVNAGCGPGVLRVSNKPASEIVNRDVADRVGGHGVGNAQVGGLPMPS